MTAVFAYCYRATHCVVYRTASNVSIASVPTRFVSLQGVLCQVLGQASLQSGLQREREITAVKYGTQLWNSFDRKLRFVTLACSCRDLDVLLSRQL